MAGFVLVTGACSTNTGATSAVASLEESDNQGRNTSALEEILEQEQQLFEFSACMRSEGIDFGDPTVDADGNVALGTPMGMITDHGGLMRAYAACRELIGNRPLGHGGEDYSSFSIASPTGDGLTRPRTFSRPRRVSVSKAYYVPMMPVVRCPPSVTCRTPIPTSMRSRSCTPMAILAAVQLHHCCSARM